MKEFQHNLRLAAEDVEALQDVAKRLRRDKSDTLRFLVHEKRAQLIASDKRASKPRPSDAG